MGDLSADVARMHATFLSGAETSRLRKISFALLNSELHSVAAYRFGRYAGMVRARSRLLALPLIILHRIWNRWITHIHHCEISVNARIGSGFLLMHRHGVTIGPATIGKNVVLHQNVTIGQRAAGGDQGVPHIGDNVWIGPGATIVGAITIGDGATISAGTVLSRDVPAHALAGGVPGRVLSLDYDNTAMLGYLPS